MSIEQIFGVVFIIIGLLDIAGYIAYLTGIKLPISFWKLKPMQDRWGKIPGTILHFIGYVVVPIIFGILLLLGHQP
ncbi:MAG: hypothetical protein GXN93_04940 [Candidatus Diapherotrites archaeon]|nr:hypothetical protein [Candidatus Diapherotrites archaeon]